jgi:transcriptional regulator with XRE-family HTH domain
MTQTRLKQLRDEAVLTVHELAEASGVSDDTISKIENGQRVARPSTLRKLAKVLVVSPQELRKPAVEEVALAGKVEPRRTGPPSLDWALRAPEEEFHGWIKNAQPIALHKLWILLSEHAKGLETGVDHRLATDRAQAATARYFRLNPPVAVRPRKTQVSADEENRESREVG